MEKMLKTDFKIDFDPKTEHWFVIKVRDELMKNHKDVEQQISGIMPENKEDHLCPVCSFRMYIEKLNPNNKFLWQTSLQKISADQSYWYGLQHIGKNTLGKFMQKLSRDCGLSQKYTNHSVHVTGITVLTRMKFSASEIM